MTQPLPPAVALDADFETWQDAQPRIADLGDMPWLVTRLAPLPNDLRGLVTTTVLPRAVACPYCGRPVASLLAGCKRPDCRQLELDADQAHVRWEDQ